MIKCLLLCFNLFILVACNSATKVSRETLSDFFVKEEVIVKNKPINVSSEVAEKSYKSYLKFEGGSNYNKKSALQRLAEIQLDMEVSEPASYEVGYESSSVEVFKKRLNDYPEDKNNDRVYYQLANAYAISGNDAGKVSALEKLTDNYADSKFYIESMFRLGESYIAKSRFLDAELALTAVIVEDQSNKFRKNALFKRAWSKYKQLQYAEAINDYNQLLSFYPKGSSTNRADQEFLNNIYKVYGICISYLGIKDRLLSLHESLKNENTRFYVYSTLANLLIKQDRDIEASTVLDMYLKNENGKYVNQVILSLSDIWLNYGNREFAMDKLLSLGLSYGVSNKSSYLEGSTMNKLSQNMILVSQFYHSLFQNGEKDNKSVYLSKAIESYSSLIKDYRHKDMDKYYFLYAELLNDSKSYKKSLSIYKDVVSTYKTSRYAAESAYSLLVLANKLFKNKTISNDDYTKLNRGYLSYLSLNKKYELLLAYSEFLYNKSLYLEVVAILEEAKIFKKENSSKLMFILASSYFEIEEYSLAEKSYHILRGMKGGNINIDKRLALSIFKQADNYKDKLLFDQAISKYNDVYKYKLDSETILLSKLEMSGLYMRLGKWKSAEVQLNIIRKVYKNTKFTNDVIRMLSIVYLNSNKYKLAAAEFESIHDFGSTDQLKRSALWQSAELYEKGADLWSSIRTYKKYARNYKTPVSLNVEAKHKLTEIYASLGLNKKRDYWLKNIINAADMSSNASDRMRYLASNASMVIAREEYNNFSSIKLTIPLKVSLRKKKKVLKEALSSLKNVNKYNRFEHVSESIYWIAEIYYNFSENLMNSERPKNISGVELEQYNVLLEDQAIPFEDQAIRYFIQNTKVSNKGVYNRWMSKSFDKLSMIYPSKYMRVEKVDSQVNLFF